MRWVTSGTMSLKPWMLHLMLSVILCSARQASSMEALQCLKWIRSLPLMQKSPTGEILKNIPVLAFPRKLLRRNPWLMWRRNLNRASRAGSTNSILLQAAVVITRLLRLRQALVKSVFPSLLPSNCWKSEEKGRVRKSVRNRFFSPKLYFYMMKICMVKARSWRMCLKPV